MTAASRITVGVDLGQKRDPTAICVCEVEWRGGELVGRDDHHVVRYLARLPLGTLYPDVASEIARILSAVRARYAAPVPEHVGTAGAGAGWDVPVVRAAPAHDVQVALYIDATGVGQPVVDLLEVAGCSPIAVTFASGEKRTKVGRTVRLGKAWMVSRLQALAQTGRLHLPQTGEAEAARRELLDYEIRVSDDGVETFGAFRGKHDDLVTAIGLATQPALLLPAYVY